MAARGRSGGMGFHGGRVSPHVDNQYDDNQYDDYDPEQEPPRLEQEQSLDVDALMHEVDDDQVEPYQDQDGEMMDEHDKGQQMGSQEYDDEEMDYEGGQFAENGHAHHQDKGPSPRGKGPGMASDEAHREYMKMRDAIEQIMAGKIIQRRAAEARFGWDMIQACIYATFLILLTVVVLQQESETALAYHAKANIHNALVTASNYGAQASDLIVPSVGTPSDIYQYLRLVLLPACSEFNITTLDEKCTEKGSHKLGVAECTADSSKCCWTRQPNFGPFAASGNFLMTPITIRQLRVRKKEETTSFGYAVEEYPSFSPDWEEVRDGGGTLPDHDTASLEIDWPADRPWYSYSRCSSTWKDSCFLDDDNAFYDSKYTKTGFVASLSGYTDQMKAQIDDLERYAFLDRLRTRAVFVEFTGYFTASKLFSSTTILFELTEVGGIHHTVKTRVHSLGQKQSLIWDIMDWIVFGYALGVVMMMDVYQLVRKGSQYFVTDSGWKVISWVNYALFIWSLFLRISNLEIYKDLSEMEPLTAKAVAFPFTEMMYWEDTYNFVNGFNVLLSWIRLLRYIEALSPGTRQLTETIGESTRQLSTLMILFMIVYTGYAFAFNLAFGSQVWDYANIGRAYMSLFEVILGDFDYYVLHQVDKTMAPLIFVTFVIVMFFILLNMILAVVMQTYDHVRDKLSGMAKTEVTGASLIGQQSKEFFRLLTAKTLDELRHPPKRKPYGQDAIAVEELDVFKREYLEEPQFKDLFSDDHDAMERMGVRTFEELMRYADISGEPRLPMSEVFEFREKLKMQENRFGHLKEQEEAKPLDADQVKAIVDATVKAAQTEITEKLQNFIQAQLAQATLFLSGVQMPQQQRDEEGRDSSMESPGADNGARQNASLY